jgi:hypothetical protein
MLLTDIYRERFFIVIPKGKQGKAANRTKGKRKSEENLPVKRAYKKRTAPEVVSTDPEADDFLPSKPIRKRKAVQTPAPVQSKDKQISKESQMVDKNTILSESSDLSSEDELSNTYSDTVCGGRLLQWISSSRYANILPC